MILNGDPRWTHDDECSLDHPCSRCEWEENARREVEWEAYSEMMEQGD